VENVLKIYPNPANNVLNVGNPKNDGIYNVTSVGTAQVTRLRSNTGILDISRLSPGTYIVEFRDGAKVVRKKFVKL
jgi:hypothetical protein